MSLLDDPIEREAGKETCGVAGAPPSMLAAASGQHGLGAANSAQQLLAQVAALAAQAAACGDCLTESNGAAPAAGQRVQLAPDGELAPGGGGTGDGAGLDWRPLPDAAAPGTCVPHPFGLDESMQGGGAAAASAAGSTLWSSDWGGYALPPHASHIWK